MPRLESQMADVSAWMQRDATVRRKSSTQPDMCEQLVHSKRRRPWTLRSLGRGHASKFTLNILYGPIRIILRLWGFDTQTQFLQALLGLAGHSLTVGTLAWQVRGECRAFEFSVHSKGQMNHNWLPNISIPCSVESSFDFMNLESGSWESGHPFNRVFTFPR